MKPAAIIAMVVLAGSLPGAPLCAQEEEPLTPELTSPVQSGTMPDDADTLLSLMSAPVNPPAPAWYSMVTNIPGDWLMAGESAFRPSGLSAMGGIALTTGVLLLGDHESYTFTHGLFTRSPSVRFGANQVLRVGDGRTTLGIAAAFALYGFAGDDSRALRTASGAVEALIASGITVQILKRIAGRESPEVATLRSGAWRPFPNLKAYNSNQPRYYAFPSGHITTAMATLTVIAENYPDERWIRPVGYGIVGLTGVSLVSKGWHWYSDFPLAVALGYSFGRIASHHDDAPGSGESPEGASLRILPNIGPSGSGVMLALNF